VRPKSCSLLALILTLPTVVTSAPPEARSRADVTKAVVLSLRFDSHGKRLLVVRGDPQVQALDAGTGEELWTGRPESVSTSGVHEASVGWSEDDSAAGLRDDQGAVTVLDG